MVDTPFWLARARRGLASLGLLLACGVPMAEARIGDTPEQMSGRMLQPDMGKNYTWPKDLNERELERMKKENPLANFAHLLPTPVEDWREQMFWKTALRKQLSNENGWRVHVYYLKGRSVVELYRRVGAPLSEFEVNGILMLMRGGQTWRRVPKVEGNEAKQAGDTVLGYEFELGDEGAGSLRARKQGDWLMVYHRRFDDYLIARKQQWDATEAERKADERAKQELNAPVSVEGF